MKITGNIWIPKEDINDEIAVKNWVFSAHEQGVFCETSKEVDASKEAHEKKGFKLCSITIDVKEIE